MPSHAECEDFAHGAELLRAGEERRALAGGVRVRTAKSRGSAGRRVAVGVEMQIRTGTEICSSARALMDTV